jgi:hypothetical protein
MNRPGDVVNGNRLGNKFVGLAVVEMNRARISQLGQPLVILFQILQIRFGRDRHRDHLASLFRRADGEDFHAR